VSEAVWVKDRKCIFLIKYGAVNEVDGYYTLNIDFATMIHSL